MISLNFIVKLLNKNLLIRMFYKKSLKSTVIINNFCFFLKNPKNTNLLILTPKMNLTSIPIRYHKWEDLHQFYQSINLLFASSTQVSHGVTLFTFMHLPWIRFPHFTHNTEFAITRFQFIFFTLLYY